MEVRDPRTGAIEMRTTPTVLHESNLPPSVFAAVQEDMRASIVYGTARYPVNIQAVEIAGKTGTGEAGFLDRFHSWLVTYGPYETDNPDERIVVSVVVDAANEWEWWAPFATAIIYQGIFSNQTYEEAMRTLGFPTHRRIETRLE
jgi:penicillin-binding protein 2